MPPHPTSTEQGRRLLLQMEAKLMDREKMGAFWGKNARWVSVCLSELRKKGYDIPMRASGIKMPGRPYREKPPKTVKNPPRRTRAERERDHRNAQSRAQLQEERRTTRPVEKRERKCMTCTKAFMSEGNHNRRCDSCKRKESHDGGDFSTPGVARVWS